MYGNQTSQVKAPETLLELLKYIVKKIPERLLKALPMTIVIGLISWLLHTYLLVYTNEGFNPDTWLGKNLLNVAGSEITSTILWTMVGAIIPMAISAAVHGVNPFKSLAAMITMPGTIIKKNKSTHNVVLPMVLFSCGIALLFDKLLSGVAGLIAGGMLMSSVVAFMTGRGSVFIQVVRMIFTDVQTFVLRKQKRPLDGDSIYLIVGSSGVALLVYGIFKSLDIFTYIFGKLGAAVPFLSGLSKVLLTVFTFLFNSVWWMLILLGIFLLVKNKSMPKKLLFFTGFVFAALAAEKLIGVRISADDGGWVEAGGTFARWIGSEGSFRAMLRGLPPALGTMLGSFLSSLLHGLFNGFGPTSIPAPFTPFSPVNQTPVQLYQEEPVPPVQTPVPPANKPPLTEEERKRLEDEQRKREQEELRRREEAERKRLLELERQKDIRVKALAEKKRLEAQRARWLAEQAELCKKYNTTPDKLMDVLRANNAANQDASKKLNNTAANWELAYKAAVVTVAGCDAAIDGLAAVTGPGGKWVRGTYKVVQGAAVGGTEAILDGKSFEKGVVGGLVKGGANAGSDFIGNGIYKAGTTIAAETVAGAITDGVEGAKNGAVNGVFNAGVGALTDKLGGKGFGDEVGTVGLAGGKTALTITTSTGNVVTKTVSDGVANSFIKNKNTNQIIQSGVKFTGAVVTELGVKPALQDNYVLPK